VNTNTEPTLRRYNLASVRGAGWAIIVIGSDGYFSTVSDWGNYAFRWGAHGEKDFREFLIRASNSPDYIVGKLSPREEYDGEETAKSIKEELVESYRSGGLTKEEVRAEFRLLRESAIENDEGCFQSWCGETKLDDPWFHRKESHSWDARQFVKKILVERLVPILKAELETERQAAAVPP
jgi:hypothetical protein